MKRNRKWTALTLGIMLMISVNSGFALTNETVLPGPTNSVRALEETSVSWQDLLEDMATIADLDDMGKTDEAILLWEEVIPQVDDMLGITFDEFGMPEGTGDDAEASLEDLKGWSGYINTFSDLIDDGILYDQLMRFAEDIDSLTESSAAMKKLESQIAILLAEALSEVDLTEVEGIFADPSEFDGMMTEPDLEAYEKLLDLYMSDEEAGRFESAQDKYDEIIDLLNQYPEMSGAFESQIFAQFKVNDENLTYIQNPVDEFGQALEITEDTSFNENTYRLLWQYVVELMPDSMTDYIDKFEVGSDGRDGTMAFVYPTNEALTKFVLNLDIKDMTDSSGAFNKKDMEETIVHEFGHVLTLNHTQMNESAKNTYVTQEGVLAKDSYMNIFYDSFWKNKTDMYLLSNEDGYREYDVERLYGDHATWFVSDYAATNVEEDISESFRVFVLEAKPSGNTIKDQKVNFFYRFPELVELRMAIRDGQ